MRKIISIVVLAVFIAGCKKYPEDTQLLHFKKPEKRFVGHWSLQSVKNYINNRPISIAFCHDHFLFSSDRFEGMTSGTTYWTMYFNYNGTCELSDHKKKLRILEQSTNLSHDFKILRCEKEHLELQADSLQFTFIPYCGS
jgi:hypothetical protein